MVAVRSHDVLPASFKRPNHILQFCEDREEPGLNKSFQPPKSIFRAKFDKRRTTPVWT